MAPPTRVACSHGTPKSQASGASTTPRMPSIERPANPNTPPVQPMAAFTSAISPTKAISMAPTATATPRPFCVPSAAASIRLAARASPNSTRVVRMRVGSVEGTRILA